MAEEETKKPEQEKMKQQPKAEEKPKSAVKPSSDKKPELKEGGKSSSVVKVEKKDKASINVKDLPISTKQAASICKFISRKNPEKAVDQLEQVLKFKKAIPMKGELPHRKGIMSGRYPIKATKLLIKLIKQLQANAEVNQLDEPITINKAIANQAARPMRRFGSKKFKRTHVYLEAVEVKK